MNLGFNFIASKLSYEELNERIDNRPKYLPETVEASITELQNRGQQFTDEELLVINQDLQAHRENAASFNIGQGLFNHDYKNNIVEDPSAPRFYSRRAIYIFSVLCGALFGSILMAINLGKINNRIGIVWVLLFGVVFTAIQIIVGMNISAGSSYGVICGLVSAFCLDYYFWNRFIGNATFYRARPIWGALIVACIFIGLILWAVILGGQRL